MNHKFQEIQEAYETLSDKAKRQLYDETFNSAKSQADPKGTRRNPRPALSTDFIDFGIVKAGKQVSQTFLIKNLGDDPKDC